MIHLHQEVPIYLSTFHLILLVPLKIAKLFQLMAFDALFHSIFCFNLIILPHLLLHIRHLNFLFIQIIQYKLFNLSMSIKKLQKDSKIK